MNDKYQQTSYFWNDHYEAEALCNPKEAIDNPEVEAALDWVTQTPGTVLDFGCGSGCHLLRCIEKGATRVIGVDLSYHAISLSRRSAAPHYESLRTKWIWGDVKSLVQLPDACLSGGILANVLEEIHPMDGVKLLNEMARLLDREGHLLLMLKPHLSDEEIQASNMSLILDEEQNPLENAYQNEAGLHLWNLTNEAVENLVANHFNIMDYKEIQMKNGHVNRVYQLTLAGGHND